jgi:hypothetical protein
VTYLVGSGLSGIGYTVTPDTILKWYRELVAKKFDGSTYRRSLGRPCADAQTEELACRLARDNPRWGYTRIRGELHKLRMHLARR